MLTGVIQTEYKPAVKGVKLPRSVAYKYASSNNIEKGAATVQLPFLYQAPSVRSGTTVAMPSPNAIPTKRRSSRRKTNLPDSSSLPQLPNLPPASPVHESGDSTTLTSLMLRGTSKAMSSKHASTSGESSTKSVKSVRLVDDISRNKDGRRSYGHVGIRPNGIIVQGRDVPSPTMNLSVALPQRAKSANDIDDDTRHVEHVEREPTTHSISTQSLKDTAERATQTLMYQAAASVEYLGKFKGTQTEPSYPYQYRRKSSIPYTDIEIEEKEALMDVIEDALGETVDRYSRQRTSQLIARNARKQAEIWRDAKEFITGTLLPQSIILANKSRRRRQTAAEIVGSIKMYP